MHNNTHSGPWNFQNFLCIKRRGRAMYHAFSRAVGGGLLAFAVLGLVGSPVAHGQVVWTGANSTLWSDPLNWIGGVPTSGTSVTIDLNAGNQPAISTANATSSDIVIGSDSSSGANTSLTISNGDILTTSGNGTIGDGAGSTGAVFVDLISAWDLSGYLYIGNVGVGSLTVSNGGNVDITGMDANNFGLILGVADSGNGTLTVTDGDGSGHTYYSQLHVDNWATVVGYNGTGALTVANVAQVTLAGANPAAVSLYIGYAANATGNVTVTGSGTSFASDLIVTGGSVVDGYNGTGSLNVTNGGYLEIDNTDGNGHGLYLGRNAGSNGTMLVDSSGAVQSQVSVILGATSVGYNGTGSLNVTNGGTFYAEGADFNIVALYIGRNAGSAGNVNVRDYNSHTPFIQVSGGGTMVGYNANGNLSLSNGGAFQETSTLPDSNLAIFYAGYNAGVTGNVTVADAVNATLRSTLTVGSGGVAIIGYNGTGNLEVSNGGNVAFSGGDFNNISAYLGFNSGSTGNLTVTGIGNSIRSQFRQTAGALMVGYNGNGTLTVADGGNATLTGLSLSNISLYLGANATGIGNVTVTDANSTLTAKSIQVGGDGMGTLTIGNGGSVTLNSGSNLTLASGASANGTLILNDGTLSLGGTNGLAAGAGNYTVNLNGGTLKVANADLTTSLNATLGASTVTTVDSNSLNATWSGVLSGEGDLAKVGNGNLSLTNINTFNGTVLVEGGSLIVTDNTSGMNNASFITVGNQSTGASLIVTNGGSIEANSADGERIALYVGKESGASATFTLSDSDTADNAPTVADIAGGAGVIGYNGTGNANILGGAFLQLEGDDAAGIGLYLGYNSGAVGNVLVSGAAYFPLGDFYQQSAIEGFSGAMIVGGNGTGNLTIANGGSVFPGSVAENELSLFLGYGAGSNGSVTITGVESASGDQSEVDVGNGATAVGYSGNGTMNITAGGLYFGDDATSDLIGMYVGYNAGANGTINVADLDITSGCLSTLDVDSGATVVGYFGNGTLNVTNGGYVLQNGSDGNVGLYVGYDVNATGTVTVSDVEQNSSISSNLSVNNGATVVGYNGTGTLNITNGGALVQNGYDGNVALYLGYNLSANGTMLVSGVEPNSSIASSLYVGNGAVVVGYNGTGNLTVADGASGNFNSEDSAFVSLYVGYNDGSAGGVTVTNGGNLSAGDVVSVGSSGNGTLTDSVGGNVTMYNLIVGDQAGGNGTVNVLSSSVGAGGTYALLNSTGDMVVGNLGNGTLNINDGGSVVAGDNSGNGNIYIGKEQGSSGTVNVSDVGSTEIQPGDFSISQSSLAGNGMYVGYNGTGVLNVTNGGLVNTAHNVYLGYLAAGNGTITVDGHDSVFPSQWNESNQLHLGYAGTGTLNVTNGATVYIGSGLVIGDQAGSNGTLRVDGNSTNKPSNVSLDSGGGLIIGNLGAGYVTISNTGNLVLDAADDTEIGLGTGSNGTLTVTDAGSQFATTSLKVGDNGTANLTVSNGGLVNATGLFIVAVNAAASANVTINGGSVIIGNDATLARNGTATVVVNGTGGNLTLNGQNIYFADYGGLTLNITNGGVLNANLSVTPFVSNQVGSNATILVDGAGSTLTVGSFVLNNQGDATMTIANGGVMKVIGGSLGLSLSSGNATLNLNSGGTLKAGGDNALYAGGGNYTFNLNGGTVLVNGSNFTTSLSANLTSGNTSTIDTNGLNATFSGNLSGTGSLTKAGGGTLELDGNNTYAGDTSVSNGTLKIKGGNLSQSGANLTVGVTIGDNATFTVSNAGNVTVLNGYFGLGDDSAGNLLVTDSNSSLNIAQDGVLDIGVNGTGCLTISNGGEVNEYSSNPAVFAAYIAQQESLDAGGSGVTVTGAGSQWNVQGSMAVGNLDTGSLSIDSGGLVSIGGVLQLGGGATGNGTLNLNDGGELDLGGTNGLQAGIGSYQANFGGGTLKVTGSDLTSSVDVTLAVSTTSTINTNGFNAGFSGGIGGGGALYKTGGGNLTLSGSNSYTDNTTVDDGALIVNGQITASTITVTGATAVLGGNGTVQDVALDNGGRVSPGVVNTVSVGVVSGFSNLTVAGNLSANLDAAPPIVWHLNTAATNAAANTSDRLTILGDISNVGTPGSTIVFDFEGTGYFDGVPADQTYTLITADNSLVGAGFSLNQFEAINVGSGGYYTNNSYFMFGNGGTSLEFVVIPEPAVWGLLAGVAALGLAWRRRELRRS